MIKVILFFLSIKTLLAIEFNYRLQGKELRCFGENIHKNTLVAGRVEGESANYAFKIFDKYQRQTTILSEKYKANQNFTFVTNSSSHYLFCIQNLQSHSFSFKYVQNTGPNAINDSQIPEKESQITEFSPIVQLIGSELKKVQVETQFLNEKQIMGSNAVQYLSMKFIYTSLITLALMGITTFCTVYKLQTYLVSKKII